MEEDISRKALKRSARILTRAREITKERIPFGPAKVKLTKRERDRMMQNAPEQQLRTAMESMDTREFLELLMRMKHATSSNQPSS